MTIFFKYNTVLLLKDNSDANYKTKLGLRQVLDVGGSLSLVNDEQDVLMSAMQQDAAF